MRTVLICNQKGGVGKTTIADELAFSFDRTNTPIACTIWTARDRWIHEPVEREDAEVAIIDTPGALQQDLKSWIEMADVIIIPTLPSSRDLVPLQTMLELVKGTSKQVYIVINEFTPSFVASMPTTTGWRPNVLTPCWPCRVPKWSSRLRWLVSL